MEEKGAISTMSLEKVDQPATRGESKLQRCWLAHMSEAIFIDLAAMALASIPSMSIRARAAATANAPPEPLCMCEGGGQ